MAIPQFKKVDKLLEDKFILALTNNNKTLVLIPEVKYFWLTISMEMMILMVKMMVNKERL